MIRKFINEFVRLGFCLAVILAYVVSGAIFGSGQTPIVRAESIRAPFQTPAEAFRASGIKQPATAAESKVARSKQEARAATNSNQSESPVVMIKQGQTSSLLNSDAPGETPLFQAWVDREFAETDQEINISVTANMPWSGPLWSYGYALQPGMVDGSYDGTEVPDAIFLNMGDTGFVGDGVYYGRSFRNVYTLKFPNGMPSGEYATSLSWFDQNGTLIQQIWVYVYYQTSSASGRYIWYIDSTEIVSRQGQKMLHVKGSFPRQLPLHVQLGKASMGRGSNMIVQSQNGRDLYIPAGQFFVYNTRESGVDVSIWDKDFRQVIFRPNAFVAKITP